ncbi:hypothetical protein ACFFR3_19420 [Nonomuraea salmonea]|uniref:Uncharacterized protein n=1 Tax=Nonomuraea salmonea TaxID=46181 RepID=A0ABV5NN18_9ACTN
MSSQNGSFPWANSCHDNDNDFHYCTWRLHAGPHDPRRGHARHGAYRHDRAAAPGRATGVTAQQQPLIAKAVKNAREVVLPPYASRTGT